MSKDSKTRFLMANLAVEVRRGISARATQDQEKILGAKSRAEHITSQVKERSASAGREAELLTSLLDSATGERVIPQLVSFALNHAR